MSLRLLVNYLSILWGKFTFPNGELDKNFTVKAKLGTYCSENVKTTICFDAIGGDASLGDKSLLPLLKLRSEILTNGKAKSVVKSALDLKPVNDAVSAQLGGVKLTDSFKELIASAALGLVAVKLPSEVNVTIFGFKNEGDSEYSISADIFLAEEWIEKNKGEFGIPYVDALGKAFGLSDKLAKQLPKVRIIFNHDCDAMAGSLDGDYQVCAPKDKTTIKLALKSSVLKDVTEGKYKELSIDPYENTYESLNLHLTNFGLGFAKGEDGSCSYREGQEYKCAFALKIHRFMYGDKENFIELEASNGAKELTEEAPLLNVVVYSLLSQGCIRELERTSPMLTYILSIRLET